LLKYIAAARLIFCCVVLYIPTSC